MGRLLDIARQGVANRQGATIIADPSPYRREAELTALVDVVADFHGFTPAQRVEALEIALADQEAALECFRILAARC